MPLMAMRERGFHESHRDLSFDAVRLWPRFATVAAFALMAGAAFLVFFRFKA